MILFISYGTGGAECINPVYQLLYSESIECLNISLSKYTKDKLSNSISVSEDEILTFIESKKPSIVINERSSGVDLQNKITSFCNNKGILNCVILDFPGNYKERFNAVPNLIFVPSESIKKMVSLGFNEKTIYATGNPSFDDLPKARKERIKSNPKILFVSQPLKKYSVGDEFYVFKQYYKYLKKNFKSFKLEIKLHPQDDFNTWEKFINKKYSANFVNDINYEKYDLIIGYDSTIMYRSSCMGIPTIFFKDFKEQIKSYIKGKPLLNPASNFEDNATKNIFNHILKLK